MNRRMSLSVMLAGIMVMMVSACASVPLAPPEMDMKAKKMTAPKNKALVYLYRHESFGAALKMTVNVDGKYMGQTASKTYFMWLLKPGKHSVDSVTENRSSINLNARAGNTYYIWQEVKMGLFSARSKLHLVDREKARDDMEKCKLIAEVTDTSGAK